MGWLVLITSLSLFSFSDTGEDKIWFPHLDKVVHASFHFGIMILGALFLSEVGSKAWEWRKRIAFLLAFSVVYGVLIEILQWLLPFDRSAEFWDVLANCFGALMGGILIQKMRSRIDRLK